MHVRIVYLFLMTSVRIFDKSNMSDESSIGGWLIDDVPCRSNSIISASVNCPGTKFVDGLFLIAMVGAVTVAGAVNVTDDLSVAAGIAMDRCRFGLNIGVEALECKLFVDSRRVCKSSKKSSVSLISEPNSSLGLCMKT